jgi:S1-C subfamily serine protease
MRLLSHIFFVCVFYFSLFAGDTGDIFIPTIERVNRSLVPILCGRFDSKGQFEVQLIDGTGFFVNDEGWFLTAAHVITDLQTITPQRPLPCIMAIYVPQDGWQRDAAIVNTRWFKFTECKIDVALDLAACKPMIAPFLWAHPLSFEEYRPPDGTPLAFSGFPLGSIEPLCSRGHVATYRNTVDEQGDREILIDKGTWPGASGSPIYSGGGRVLGILLARGTAEATGIAVGRPTNFILAFLRKNDIRFTSTKSSPKNYK